MDESERQKFALSLYSRLKKEAIYLEQAKVRIGTWIPQPHWCHNNIRDWVKHSPQHKQIYGFIFFEVFAPSGFVQFAPHSVVELEDGSLVDITPHEASLNYPFLRHTGTEAEFSVIAEGGNLDLPLNILRES